MKFLKGIRFRLLILGLLPAAILAFSLTFWFIQTRIDELDETLTKRGESIVKNLAPASLYGIFSGSDYLLQRLTDNVILEPDVVEVAIYNKKQQRRAYSQKATPDSVPGHELSNFSQPVVLAILKDEKSDPFSTLIEVSKDKNQIIGEVRVTLSRTSTIAGQQEIVFTSILITTLGLLISLLLAYRLSLKISYPLLALAETVKQVSEGDLSARSEIDALEELNELKEGLNAMAESLEENQTHLKAKIKSATLDLNHSLQVLESQNRQKSQFLAHMSHEIRTPMNGILGFIRLLTDSPLTPTQSNQLQLIETSANNLLTIINEILDHAELESGNLKLNISSFDLRRSAEETIALLAPLAHEKGLHLILLIDESVPKLLNSDPIRLRQVLFNLAGNAIKFTLSGEIIIRIRAKKGSLLFTVSDNGQGISSREQKSLFTPFSQAKTEEEFPSPGTGLGLNIALSIIHALNGKIGLASKESFGSTFWFTLPLIDLPQAAAITDILESKPQPTQPKQVLILDKNKLSRLSFQQQLLSVGVVATETSFEALNDLLLADELSNYDALIVNTDNIQPLDELDKLKGQLTILATAHSKPAKENPLSIERYLQLPCTQTALLEALSQTASVPNPVSNKTHILEVEAPPAPKLKFLVADDIEINRLLLIEQIRPHWNVDIVEAEDGEEALEQLKKQAFDLAFLDLRMPKRSGLSALKSLMAAPAGLNHETPFIAITAYLPENSREELFESGFSEIIIKPIAEDDLAELVNRLLKRNRKKSRQIDFNRDLPKDENSSLFGDFVNKVGGNEELACSLLKKLNDDLSEQLKTAQRTFESGDLKIAQDAVHRIHGSACYFDIPKLIQLTRQLEIALEDSDLDNANELFPLLKAEIAQFIIHCQRFLDDTLRST